LILIQKLIVFSYLPRDRLKRPRLGNIGYISQSGSVGSTIIDWLAEEHVGISKFISYENGMDVNECDLIEYLADDKRTKVITVFLEGVIDGKRFIKVSKKASKKKPIIILKGGRSITGARAVASHTGALAGSTKIYSAVFKQTGLIETRSWEELFDCAEAFSTQPLPKKIRKHIPAYGSLHNPIDLTGDVTSERYKIIMEECLKSKEYDGIIAITLFQVPTLNSDIVDVIGDMKKFNKPILCCSAGGDFSQKISKALERKGIPVFETPQRVVKAMAALVEYKRWLSKS